INDPLILSNMEFTAIFDALAVLDETEELPVTEVAQGLDSLTIGDVGEIVSKGSYILRARLSDELVNNLGEEKIHPDAYVNKTLYNDLNQTDLDDLFE